MYIIYESVLECCVKSSRRRNKGCSQRVSRLLNLLHRPEVLDFMPLCVCIFSLEMYALYLSNEYSLGMFTFHIVFHIGFITLGVNFNESLTTRLTKYKLL